MNKKAQISQAVVQISETKTTLGELAEDALEMLGVRPSDKN